MRADGFIDICRARSLPDSSLQNALVQMMPANDAGLWIYRTLRSREDILPAPFTTSIGILDTQGIGQNSFTVTFAEVFLMQGSDILKVDLQLWSQANPARWLPDHFHP